MEAKEQMYASCVISCCQDADFEEAMSPPIQWRARKREGAPPGNSNASVLEPNGDGKRELERDPSGEMCHRKEGASEDCAKKLPEEQRERDNTKQEAESTTKKRPKRKKPKPREPKSNTTQETKKKHNSAKGWAGRAFVLHCDEKF